jgi:hypothetical protein
MNTTLKSIALTATLLAGAIQAQVVYTQDFNSATLGPSNTPLSGWIITGQPGDSYFGQAFGGVQINNQTPVAADSPAAYLQVANSFFGANTSPTLTADTSVTYIANTVYTLSFDFIGKDNGNEWFRGTTFTYQIWAGNPTGGTLLGTANTSAAAGQNTISSLTLMSTSNAGGSGNLFLVFSATNAGLASGATEGDRFRQAIIDNVSVSISSIPEPATTAALAGLGMLGFAALRRRRN